MGGKLIGFLVMALAALFAWKWLRAQQTGGARPPAPRDETRRPGGRGGEDDVITLERDPETGVYRPGGEKTNENDRS
jgi:hypothetical protein